MKENAKQINLSIRMDTPYGKNVLDCMEKLKVRMGLSLNRIIQDALVHYEGATRETGDETAVQNTEEQIPEKPMPEEALPAPRKSDDLSLLLMPDTGYLL